MINNNRRGFSLVELLIVLAIMSIIAMVAIPAYNSSIMKTRRTDGQTALMDIMARQERFFTENNTYTTNLAALPANAASKEGFYTVVAAACGAGIDSCVLLTATPSGAQADDGAITLDSTGQKLPADKW